MQAAQVTQSALSLRALQHLEIVGSSRSAGTPPIAANLRNSCRSYCAVKVFSFVPTSDLAGATVHAHVGVLWIEVIGGWGRHAGRAGDNFGGGRGADGGTGAGVAGRCTG